MPFITGLLPAEGVVAALLGQALVGTIGYRWPAEIIIQLVIDIYGQAPGAVAKGVADCAKEQWPGRAVIHQVLRCGGSRQGGIIAAGHSVQVAPRVTGLRVEAGGAVAVNGIKRVSKQRVAAIISIGQVGRYIGRLVVFGDFISYVAGQQDGVPFEYPCQVPRFDVKVEAVSAGIGGIAGKYGHPGSRREGSVADEVEPLFKIKLQRARDPLVAGAEIQAKVDVADALPAQLGVWRVDDLGIGQAGLGVAAVEIAGGGIGGQVFVEVAVIAEAGPELEVRQPGYVVKVFAAGFPADAGRPERYALLVGVDAEQVGAVEPGAAGQGKTAVVGIGGIGVIREVMVGRVGFRLVEGDIGTEVGIVVKGPFGYAVDLLHGGVFGIIAVQAACVTGDVQALHLVAGDGGNFVLFAPAAVVVELEAAIVVDGGTVAEVEDPAQGDGSGEGAVAVVLGIAVDEVAGIIAVLPLQLAAGGQAVVILVKQLCVQAGNELIGDAGVDPDVGGLILVIRGAELSQRFVLPVEQAGCGCGSDKAVAIVVGHGQGLAGGVCQGGIGENNVAVVPGKAAGVVECRSGFGKVHGGADLQLFIQQAPGIVGAEGEAAEAVAHGVIEVLVIACGEEVVLGSRTAVETERVLLGGAVAVKIFVQVAAHVQFGQGIDLLTGRCGAEGAVFFGQQQLHYG